MSLSQLYVSKNVKIPIPENYNRRVHFLFSSAHGPQKLVNDNWYSNIVRIPVKFSNFLVEVTDQMAVSTCHFTDQHEILGGDTTLPSCAVPGFHSKKRDDSMSTQVQFPNVKQSRIFSEKTLKQISTQKFGIPCWFYGEKMATFWYKLLFFRHQWTISNFESTSRMFILSALLCHENIFVMPRTFFRNCWNRKTLFLHFWVTLIHLLARFKFFGNKYLGVYNSTLIKSVFLKSDCILILIVNFKKKVVEE